MTYKEEGERIAGPVQVHLGVVVEAECWLVAIIIVVIRVIGGHHLYS